MSDNQGTFFNTINLHGIELLKAKDHARTQQDEIYAFLLEHKGNGYTPFQIQDELNYKEIDVPVTSVRRALCNLQQGGLIEKFDEMVNGVYGKPNHKWGIK